ALPPAPAPAAHSLPPAAARSADASARAVPLARARRGSRDTGRGGTRSARPPCHRARCPSRTPAQTVHGVRRPHIAPRCPLYSRPRPRPLWPPQTPPPLRWPLRAALAPLPVAAPRVVPATAAASLECTPPPSPDPPRHAASPVAPAYLSW